MRILITGAAQGIGAAIASSLTNHELVLVDLQPEKLAALSNELRTQGAKVTELVGNLTDSNFLKELCEFMASNPIDVLINNAGVVHDLKNLTELEVADLDLAYAVNIKAPFVLAQAAVKTMKPGGLILNTASRANVYGYSQMAAYAASKAAITSISGTVALENPNLKSITIIPGRTNTPMQARIRGREEAEKSQSPEFVGQTIAQIINGQIETKTGQLVLIDYGKYKVMDELDKSDLHSHMH